DERAPPAHHPHDVQKTIRPPVRSRIARLGLIGTLHRQTHRTPGDYGGDCVLVDHLADSVLQQNDELVERFDLALQLDAINQIDGYRNTFLAQNVQVRVL